MNANVDDRAQVSDRGVMRCYVRCICEHPAPGPSKDSTQEEGGKSDNRLEKRASSKRD